MAPGQPGHLDRGSVDAKHRLQKQGSAVVAPLLQPCAYHRLWRKELVFLSKILCQESAFPNGPCTVSTSQWNGVSTDVEPGVTALKDCVKLCHCLFIYLLISI